MNNNRSEFQITFKPTKGNEKIKEELEKIAQKNFRKLNNYLEMLFLKHIEESKQEPFKPSHP